MIQDQKLPHYYNDSYIGDLTHLQNLELRCKIAENNLKGYFLIFDNEKIIIENNGNMNFKSGLYDQEEILYTRLFKIQKVTQ